MSPTDLLPVKVAADELGLHTDTIKRYIREGILEGSRLPGGHWRVTRESVDALKQPQGA